MSHLLIIEDEKDIVEAIEYNLKKENFKVSKAYDGSSGLRLAREKKPDLIILDPPRSGMHDDTLRDILAYRPKEIVYVSCNFKNFAREIVLLQETYTIKDMIAIDQFPHTPHVELITKLELK